MTLLKTKEKRTSHYKRYAKSYMSPTGINRTNKGLHIKVQKVCKAVYEPRRDKQNKQRTFILKYKRYAKPYMSPTGTSRTKKRKG